MINGPMRPWGTAAWLLKMPTLREKSWFLIGSLSTQQRCRALLLHHGQSISIDGCGLIYVHDEESAFSELAKVRINENLNAVAVETPVKADIAQFGLFHPLKQVQKQISQWVDQASGNFVVDVSTLPERFCFPIIRWLVENVKVENLVLTYMIPATYTEQDLGYDSRDWGPLPTFVDDLNSAKVEHVIVGVGFLPYSLPDWLKKTYSTPEFKISLVLPFPAAPSSVSRSWEFVRRVEKDLNIRDDRQIHRIAAHDLWGTYQRINTLTGGGTSKAIFAPYGPKAHSMAMCLYALRHGSEVFFTQPSYYHPEYSQGMAMDDGLPLGYAYAVRLGGQDFF